MRTYTLLRQAFEPNKPTRGALNIDGEIICTLENPWTDNKPFVSCIPQGCYKVAWRESPSKGWCWRLHNVPDRDHILIHKGNTEKDTQGCILVGMAHVIWRGAKSAEMRYNIPAVSQSRVAFNYMSKLLGNTPWYQEILDARI